MVNQGQMDIIIQARMSSSRLPGKVLRNLHGKTMLAHILLRLQQCTGISHIIVATSGHPSDDPVEQEARLNGAETYRGSLNDVLARYYHAATAYGSKHIIRICADSPLVDPPFIQRGINKYLESDYDYLNTKCPLGTGFEIFSFPSLENAYLNAGEPYQREHVTPYIIDNAGCKHQIAYDIAYPPVRLTVDTPEDWQLIETVYGKLYKGKHDFYFPDIVALINREPHLAQINAHVQQIDPRKDLKK